MRSPKDMQVIQIDITNACIHSCSNCTRLCGHHRKPFFMGWETFQRAVDSLEDFHGTVGIMGGEPTLHPEFERFVRYLGEKNPHKKENALLLRPTKDFMRSLCEEETEKTVVYQTAKGSRTTIPGPGLWTSLNERYLHHYELIQDIFQHQMVNDHTASSMHQPVLVTRKELGITDEEWPALRDRCWIQNEWSATITPKGAFFCEVAGALDMLFDGPGGWPVEKGWWKREPKDFQDQIHWCELCGMALNTCTRDANEETDDVSPSMYEKIKRLGGSKVKNNRVHVLKLSEKGEIEEEGRGYLKKNIYLDDYELRFHKERGTLYPKGFHGIVFCGGQTGIREFVKRLLWNLCQLLSAVVVFESEETMLRFQKEIKETAIEAEARRLKTVLNRESLFGTGMNRAIGLLDKDSYIIHFTPGICFAEDLQKRLRSFVINPGTIFYQKGKPAEEVSFLKDGECPEKERIDLFHSGAYAIRRAGLDRTARIKDMDEWAELWEEKKRLPFSDRTFSDTASFVKRGGSYIIYGTSRGGKNTSDYVAARGGRILAYSDSSEEKWGKEVYGKKVISPFQIPERLKEADAVIVASSYFSEIKPKLLELGIPESKIIISTASF